MGGGLVCGIGDLARGTYQFVVGDDLDTLRNEHASGADKFLAVVDLASNALVIVPIAGEGVEAARLAAKAALKGGAKLEAHQITYDEAVRISKRLVRTTARDVAEGCTPCFPAGTLVATPKGEVPIEALHVGDQVLAENPSTGKVEPQPLEAMVVEPVQPLLELDLADGSTLRVTPNHAFWVEGGPLIRHAGWLEAGQLLPGDHLRTVVGTEATVIRMRYHVGQAVVYTLTVAHDHTFFVGTARVLVHNGPRCLVRVTIPLRPQDLLNPLKLTDYLYKVAAKYGINLRGSGKQITIIFDDTVDLGRTKLSEGGRIIRIGLGSIRGGEAEVANTIAHELNHARDLLANGKWTKSELDAIDAGENLELWIMLTNE